MAAIPLSPRTFAPTVICFGTGVPVPYKCTAAIDGKVRCLPVPEIAAALPWPTMNATKKTTKLDHWRLARSEI